MVYNNSTATERKAKTMTNVEIIAKAMKANGIEEPSHAFAAWKKLGYVVKKGEKAAFKARIWKYTTKQTEEGEVENNMFLKTAHFFTASQVKPLDA